MKTTISMGPQNFQDLASYLYDRQQATPLAERHVNNFMLWITDWLDESKSKRIERNTLYLKEADNRTPEFHRQLVHLAEKIGMVK